MEKAIKAVKSWAEGVVVHHNLCPFAALPLRDGRVRFVCCDRAGFDDLDAALSRELLRLRDCPDSELSNTLLILTKALGDFWTFNEYLGRADGLLEKLELLGKFQIASFHPDYQFAGTQPGEASNFTNRAPYPVLHLLRESEVENAVSLHKDSLSIPDRNVAYLEALGKEQLGQIKSLSTCPEGG